MSETIRKHRVSKVIEIEHGGAAYRFTRGTSFSPGFFYLSRLEDGGRWSPLGPVLPKSTSVEDLHALLSSPIIPPRS